MEEKNSEFVKTGNPVIVIADNEKFKGMVGNVAPTVAENKIQFNVHLEENSNPHLIPKPNSKPESTEIDPRKCFARCSRSVGFKANTEQTIYVFDSAGNMVPRTVNFGIKGVDYQEVISGLNEGEKVVLSDMPFSWGTKKIKGKN